MTAKLEIAQIPIYTPTAIIKIIQESIKYKHGRYILFYYICFFYYYGCIGFEYEFGDDIG